MDFQVLPIDEIHIHGFHACLDEVARERRYLAFLEAPPFAESEAFVRKNIEKHNPQFVAIADASVIGWCDITPMERPVFAHRGSLGMGVLRQFRGAGVGRALIVATLAAARAKRLERIELEVLEDNSPAISLYQSMGFVVEGVKRGAYRLDGRLSNLLTMALSFNSIA